MIFIGLTQLILLVLVLVLIGGSLVTVFGYGIYYLIKYLFKKIK